MCFQEDLFRKQARWTQSSDQITIIRDETDLEESRIIVQGKPPRLNSTKQSVGPANPTCRPVSPVGPPFSVSFLRCFSTASKVQSMPLLKVGSYQGLRFDVAMDSWAHRTPSALYKRTPTSFRASQASSSII
jgi:hypothetical protein